MGGHGRAGPCAPKHVFECRLGTHEPQSANRVAGLGRKRVHKAVCSEDCGDDSERQRARESGVCFALPHAPADRGAVQRRGARQAGAPRPPPRQGEPAAPQDASTAKALAFAREVKTRCVTLDGDDFNPSGTLTGTRPR